jgi:hypothetical protein
MLVFCVLRAPVVLLEAHARAKVHQKFGKPLELYTISLPPPRAGIGKLPALAGWYFGISFWYYIGKFYWH